MSDILDTLVTDRTADDVAAKNEKGTYNASDMNRVNAAVAYLRPIFTEFGYTVEETELREWAENELPRITEAEQFLRNVLALDGRFRYAENMIPLPSSMVRLTHTGANNIEKFLAAMPEVFERMAAAWYFSDELFCGEV